MTWDGASARLYVDDEPVDSVVFNERLNANIEDLRIGTRLNMSSSTFRNARSQRRSHRWAPSCLGVARTGQWR